MTKTVDFNENIKAIIYQNIKKANCMANIIAIIPFQHIKIGLFVPKFMIF